jgi:hypothetical protein
VVSSEGSESHKHYMTATSGQMAQLGNLGDVTSLRSSMGISSVIQANDDTEEGLYGMSGSAFDKTTKRKPGAEGESISDLFDRAKNEIKALTVKYNERMDELKAQRDKRREAKSAVKNWLSDFEKKNGRPAAMDDRKQAQNLFVTFRELTKACEDLEKEKDEVLGQKIEAEGRLRMVEDQVKQLGVDEDEFRGVDLEPAEPVATSPSKGHKSSRGGLPASSITSRGFAERDHGSHRGQKGHE